MAGQFGLRHKAGSTITLVTPVNRHSATTTRCRIIFYFVDYKLYCGQLLYSTTTIRLPLLLCLDELVQKVVEIII